jgi:hypothetical protein
MSRMRSLKHWARAHVSSRAASDQRDALSRALPRAAHHPLRADVQLAERRRRIANPLRDEWCQWFVPLDPIDLDVAQDECRVGHVKPAAQSSDQLKVASCAGVEQLLVLHGSPAVGCAAMIANSARVRHTDHASSRGGAHGTPPTRAGVLGCFSAAASTPPSTTASETSEMRSARSPMGEPCAPPRTGPSRVMDARTRGRPGGQASRRHKFRCMPAAAKHAAWAGD